MIDVARAITGRTTTNRGRGMRRLAGLPKVEACGEMGKDEALKFFGDRSRLQGGADPDDPGRLGAQH